MKSIVRKPFLIALFLGASCSMTFPSLAHAETLFTMMRSITPPETYTPGTAIDVTVQLDLYSDGTPAALGFEETLPEGWTYQGRVSGPTLLIEPPLGKDGLLEFAWLTVPPFPLIFVYRVHIPSDAAGEQLIQGRGLVRILIEGEIRTPETITILTEGGERTFHSADIDWDNRIDLSELLRVIQFYNSGGYSCAHPGTPTEDGYLPGAAGLLNCLFHSGDYNPQDWVLSLSELLRIIQFYNIGGYHHCPELGTEDGFCVGAY